MARKLTTADRRWHRKSAVSLFNEVWRLLEKRRTPAEDDRMIHAAHASRFHWGEVGTAANRAIGEWQASHVYSLLCRPEPATYHAVRSLAPCNENGIQCLPLAPSPAEPARVEAFGRYAGEGDIEACLEIVVHEASRVMAPQWREDPQSELIGDAIHPRMLVVRSDGANDHAIDVDSPKDPSQRVELTVLPRRGGLPDQGDPYSLRLELREVQVRRVEQHRVVILWEDGEKMGHVPAPLHRDIGRIGGVLPSGEQGGHAHARWRAMEGKRLRDPMLTLFKVDQSSTFANHLWPSRRFHRVRDRK